MESQVLSMYDFPSYHMDSNDELVSIVSHQKMVIHNKKTGEIVIAKNVLNPWASLVLNNKKIIVKKKNSEYILYDMILQTSNTLVPSNNNGLSENSYPILYNGGDTMSDYSFFSPNKQLFLSNLSYPYDLGFYDYSGDGQVVNLIFDPIDKKLCLIDYGETGSKVFRFHYNQLLNPEILDFSFLKAKVLAYAHLQHQYLIIFLQDHQLKTYNKQTQKIDMLDGQFLKEGGAIYYKSLLSPSHRFLISIFSEYTKIYDLSHNRKSHTIYIKYNHFAALSKDESELYIGSWEKGLRLIFESADDEMICKF